MRALLEIARFTRISQGLLHDGRLAGRVAFADIHVRQHVQFDSRIAGFADCLELDVHRKQRLRVGFGDRLRTDGRCECRRKLVEVQKKLRGSGGVRGNSETSGPDCCNIGNVHALSGFLIRCEGHVHALQRPRVVERQIQFCNARAFRGDARVFGGVEVRRAEDLAVAGHHARAETEGCTGQ